jgi:lysosomal acid lipase/cholesteryl ester hydrolase
MINRAKSPAFMAAQAGYDVWLGNNRGTLYSRKHETLNARRDFF